MKKRHEKQPRYRLLKVGCVGAGLLSISNPTQVTAADLGVLDVYNDTSLGTIPNPFPQSPLGVHLAIGDLDDDGFGEIVIGPGRGGPSVAMSGLDRFLKVPNIPGGAPLPSGAGVRVATGDLDGDGRDDIIATPATGRASTSVFLKIGDIKAADTTDWETIAESDDIFEGFSGGVDTASGDVDGDSFPDVLAGRLSCACGRPIKIKKPPLGSSAFEDFGPPVPSGQGGVQVATGDIDGDSLDDFLVLPINPTTGVSQPLVALSQDKHKDWIEVLSFSEPAGVHVAMGDVNNDGVPELVVGSARGLDSYVKVYPFEITPGVPGVSMGKAVYEWINKSSVDTRTGIRVAVGDVNGDSYADIAYGPASIPEPATLGSLFVSFGVWLLGARPGRRHGEPPG